MVLRRADGGLRGVGAVLERLVKVLSAEIRILQVGSGQIIFVALLDGVIYLPTTPRRATAEVMSPRRAVTV